MALNNFVKFVRGSNEAFNQLQSKNKDTLYFITTRDENNNVIKTEMYLGEVLISDGNEAASAIQNLSQLKDVVIDTENLQDGMYLAYDSDTQSWVPQTPTEISVEEMVGAIADDENGEGGSDGSAGLVPAPKKADVKKVLTGDGQWRDLQEISNLNELTTTVNTLVGVDTGVTARTIAAEEVAKIVNQAPEDFNTLKEIADWITNHPADISEVNSKILEIQDLIGYSKTEIEGENGEITSVVTSTVQNLQTALEELETELNDNSATILDIAKLLGTVDEEGTISITSAPVGKLEELELYKTAIANGNEAPESIVDAINMLTEQLLWGEISAEAIEN